ncbi:unnamed protein product [Pleuronectes platessa]|uniref:Fibronectin type-III domain-containing protein n=1 Tax=Pleuronectes platessa TaxID=8262 RepID=A0A9N7YI66_PLEPL|nr:unnamed protein product [Pleuronectes platessa]
MDLGGSMEVAALGRPFSLGMLYDCRRDLLVPGMTLWDRDDLKKHIRERPQNSNDFEIVASDSIEDKSSALKVEASLKASFLGGLVEVGGSAKYLNDHKTSRNQARVTLKYETTTKFQELSMKHLGRGNVKHPEVFDKGIATHVVTAILYGAQAFFVFDREMSETEDHQDVQVNLKVTIKKIPCISIEGEGSLHMEDKEKANVEKFSCKFHGDFCLEKNPVSFQDAISVGLVQEAQTVLEDFMGESDSFLSASSNYSPSEPTKPDEPQQQWFTSQDIAKKMRKQAKLFSDYAEANKENKNIKFLIVGLTNETQKGSSIYLYEDGFSVNENFEPPSKPESVKARDINHNSVTLKISPPRSGAENITSYSVEYCVHGEDGWTQKTVSKDGDVTVSDLSPNTEYVFRCRAVTSVGVGPVNEVSGTIRTLPCSPPGEPRVEPHSSEITVSWQRPAELGQDVHVLSYIVEYAQADNVGKAEDLQWNQTMSESEEVIISELQLETEYVVRVTCDCGGAGTSKESISVNVCTKNVKPERSQRLADAVKKQSKLLEPQSGSLPVYKISLKEEDITVNGCKRFHFGKESSERNRTIMVLGATGAGKSTLINGMINYVLGVEWNDNYRFKLVDEGQATSQAHSQTTEVTVYKLNRREGFNIPNSLTIVDTPGFGDMRSIEKDKLIVEQLRDLFSAEGGVSEIDAVCFVAQASSYRLTPTQKYVFDSVLSIFGKDVAENIRVLVTFADGQCPPVLEAINEADVPCPKTKEGLPVHFKFNNSALFAQNKSSAAESASGEDDEGDFDEMFWNMGIKSMRKFFTALNVMTTKSLTMTKDVLRERQQLEVSVQSLKKQVKIGLNKLEEIKETTSQLRDHEAEISRNKDFVIECKVMKAFQYDNSGSGTYLTNCQQCNFTCHNNCPYANDADKRRCVAMGPDGYCKMCPGKCLWSVHFNQKYKWEYKEVIERITVKDLKEKYLKASEAATPVRSQIDRLKAEYDLVQTEVVKVMGDSTKCLNRLKEIALRPNPLSTPEYIDMLIEGEKAEAKSGWKTRVQYLMDMREQAEFMAKVERGEEFLQSSSSDFQSFL